METYIKWFGEISREDVSLVGGKGANLGELYQGGFPVPFGFCISVRAYNDFQRENEDEIQKIADSIDFADQSDLKGKSQKIRDILLRKEITQTITKDIEDALLKLTENQKEPVAIRSSATAEDLPTASFAGQHETFLNVAGKEDILQKVKECWASLWTPRAIGYRLRQGFESEKVGMCVVVQRMLIPSVSGVMFTFNSMEGTGDEIVIESTFGLGEGLVAGIVTPDAFIINKENLKIVKKTISEKDFMIVPMQGGTEQVKVPGDKRRIPSISDDKALELARIGLKIEAHYKTPQDIEWCRYKDRLFILQSRPITGIGRTLPVLSKEELKDLEGEWTKSPLDERVQEPLTPFTWSIAKESIPSFFEALGAFGFRFPEEADMVRLFYGRPYVSKTELEKIFKDLPGVVDDFLMGGQAQLDRKKIKFSPSMLTKFFRALILVNQVHKDWDREYPRILAEFESLKRFQMKKATSEELLAQLDHILGLAHSIAATHALSIIFCEALYQILVMFVGRYVDDDADLLSPKLVSALWENKTLETNKELWRLAMKAKESELIYTEISSGNYRHMVALLHTKKDGKDFLNDFHKFLRTYGHRSPKYDLIYPSWGDDPDLVLELIRAYLSSATSSNPNEMEKKGIKERENATRLVFESLNVRALDRIFPVKRLVFKRLLQLTQKYMMLRENQQFYIGQGYPIARAIVLEIGSRFVEMGIIKEPSDVFFLKIEEIRSIVSGSRERHIQMMVEERKKEFESFKKVEPPSLITKDGAKEWTEKEILKGIAGSPGIASGTAKIILDIGDFSRFKEGEILIAPTTNPSWTPLFIMAKAVVTEVGGLLSHGAVVAREYGIPAVLGVKNATRRLKDGQKITVDGGSGMIYTKD
ncbi:MAG: hypothetical protein JSV56_03585 [Methanomassiliicoccales archaeon]|nr:MAG: hypothetical protein JSV56_03585 [Methanomassiliicoccales archaeon]